MNMTLHEFSNAYMSKLKDSNLELYETIINDFQDINVWRIMIINKGSIS